MRKKRLLLSLIVALLLLPVWMWLAWLLTPKKKMVVAIIDKTVLNPQAQEHISLDWILNHERFTKTKKDLYEPARDYFGFFPGLNDQYKLKGLERFSADQLKNLSSDADLVYFTDTYGIYKSEWYRGTPGTERSDLIYGGMSQEDMGLLEDMKARHKLMIAEFNTIGSPTPPLVRDQFEQLFGLHWTGWTGRYFASLDTTENKELPHWLVTSYKLEHGGQWPFQSEGIAFVNNNEKVVILAVATHLTDPVPSIESTDPGQLALDIPKSLKYPFWFDIIDPSSTQNEIAANFVIHTNGAGEAELRKNGIPSRFPAVLMHNGSDYRFYYFSGDFCDNPISLKSSYFNGIPAFRWLFYDVSDANQRVGFFWNFYRPMMNRILYDNYRNLPK